MSNKEYNGWTNYETWRVCLEFGFTDTPRDFEDYDAEGLRDYVEEFLESEQQNEHTLSLGYAYSFVQEVNFYEIVEHVQDCIKADDEYQEEAANE
ncbi:MAG: hypothetical protein NZ824_12205 [Candidatus Thioglobus sp.]|nr:hypothetical protein [Candidatus Thioglobus sp.]